MSSKARRVREKAALKREILNAARDLFAEDGYENVSMRRIAKKIDYSPTTVYLHFVDKADLLFHICEETFAKLVARGDKLLAQKIDPLTKLKMFGRTYIEFGLKHPDHYRLTFMVQHEPGELEERYENSMGHRAFEFLRLCVEECIGAGVFRRIDLSHTSQALWAAVHGITSLLIARPDFPWTDRNQTIDLLIDSLCAGFSKEERKPGAVKTARRSEQIIRQKIHQP